MKQQQQPPLDFIKESQCISVILTQFHSIVVNPDSVSPIQPLHGWMLGRPPVKSTCTTYAGDPGEKPLSLSLTRIHAHQKPDSVCTINVYKSS